MTVSRRITLLVVGTVIIVGLGYSIVMLTGVIPPSTEDLEITDSAYGYPVNETRLHEFERNMKSGGPPPDGIPPIETPIYIDVDEANEYLDDADIVFGFVQDDVIYAYPQRILVWHEIVNEVIDGKPVSITYCPLTGSAVGFSGQLPGNDTTFGTTGRLVNSNLIMYDRATRSYFPQILSQAINKNYNGLRLERIHLIWTTWAKWKAAHPETMVLSTETGFVRDYDRDPYGSYSDVDSYYHNDQTLFPVMDTDDRLLGKDVVIGLDNFESQHAIQKQHLRDQKVINVNLGNESYVVFYDDALDTARSFSSTLNNQAHTFSYIDGAFVDDQTQNEWSINGESVLGNLTLFPNMDVMWFAWAAYFPNTGLSCMGC
ncbi:MAG: DUF3179 domain-containing protein [Candidatus Thorarchaeota archaeon]